jgi:exodeoxyribonuclease V alpha subunit
MKLWTSPDLLPPEIDLLVRRWHLPAERVADIKRLLADQALGGTAAILPASSPATPAAWGSAAQLAPASAAALPAPTPLVLQHHRAATYLQSWRFFQAEHTIAGQLLARAARPAPALSDSSAVLLARLGTDKINALQSQAIACALEHPLALITGGPGTGKTHTLARLLALLLAAQPTGTAPVIRLAAPTGKAAERMKEAIEAAADSLPANLPADTQIRLKTTAASASTLHKLLGFHPGNGRCRFNAQAPLLCDVLIVDECSMVDTLQWQALLTSLPPAARLILLGDPNQLESVSAGDVLGSLVRHARANPASPLAGTWTELTESLRFQKRPAIGALAQAVVHNQPDDALALLKAHSDFPADATLPADGLTWLGDHAGRFTWSSLPAPVQSALAAIADAPTPAEALIALSKVRLLAAHRENTVGVAGLNTAIERHLRARPGTTRAPNQPLIINRNDPETGLTNGSVGIIMMDTDGVPAAFFPGDSAAAAPRRIPLGQLPEHGPAWAMTIHRSQGSEFDQVVVILPSDESPLATRELIYTGITRAKHCVHVWGSEATVRKALTDHTLRCTLLESALASAAPPK